MLPETPSHNEPRSTRRTRTFIREELEGSRKLSVARSTDSSSRAHRRIIIHCRPPRRRRLQKKQSARSASNRNHAGTHKGRQGRSRQSRGLRQRRESGRRRHRACRIASRSATVVVKTSKSAQEVVQEVASRFPLGFRLQSTDDQGPCCTSTDTRSTCCITARSHHTNQNDELEL